MTSLREEPTVARELTEDDPRRDEVTVRCYRRSPYACGWYRKGTWARQFRSYNGDGVTWWDWWRKAEGAMVA